MHIASAPGEAPAIDYGKLINSIKAVKVGTMGAATITDSNYAVPLEFGSAKRDMAARPFFTPAADMTMQKINSDPVRMF